MGGGQKLCQAVSFLMFLLFEFLPQNCDSQELRVVTSRSGYPKKRTLPLTEDFCLIVSKMRNLYKNEFRKKAFEEHYKHETPLHSGSLLDCKIIEGAQIYPFGCGVHIVECLKDVGI